MSPLFNNDDHMAHPIGNVIFQLPGQKISPNMAARTMAEAQFNNALNDIFNEAASPDQIIASPATLSALSTFDGRRLGTPVINPGSFTVGLGPIG